MHISFTIEGNWYRPRGSGLCTIILLIKVSIPLDFIKYSCYQRELDYGKVSIRVPRGLVAITPYN